MKPFSLAKESNVCFVCCMVFCCHNDSSIFFLLPFFFFYLVVAFPLLSLHVSLTVSFTTSYGIFDELFCTFGVWELCISMYILLAKKYLKYFLLLSHSNVPCTQCLYFTNGIFCQLGLTVSFSLLLLGNNVKRLVLALR